MVGMGMRGNEKVDVIDAKFLEIAHNPIALIHVTGIDQDDLVAEEDESRIALPDIEKIHPEVAAVLCLVHPAGGCAGGV
jgi:predicted nucleic acid-binding protein